MSVEKWENEMKDKLTHVNKLTSYPAAKQRWVSSGKRAWWHLTGGLPSPPAVSGNDVIRWGKFKEQKWERLWEKIYKCYRSYRCYILPADISVAGGIILITLIIPIILIKFSLTLLRTSEKCASTLCRRFASVALSSFLSRLF